MLVAVTLVLAKRTVLPVIALCSHRRLFTSPLLSTADACSVVSWKTSVVFDIGLCTMFTQVTALLTVVPIILQLETRMVVLSEAAPKRRKGYAPPLSVVATITGRSGSFRTYFS